jgi:hypothetical protein
MALRLRRGTDAERLLITPVDGELIYTTDTKLLYVGDGTTAGGTLVTGSGGGGGSTTLDALTDTDLTGAANNDVLTFNGGTNKWEALAVPGVGTLNLRDLGDVFMPGTPNRDDILKYDGLNFTAQPISEFFNEQQNYKINIAGDDSTIIIDTDTNTVTGNFVGDLTGNVTGNTTGYHTGDVRGSVVADDSTILVDAVAGSIPGENITGNVTATFTGNLTGDVVGDVAGSVFGDDSTLIIDGLNNTISCVAILSNQVNTNLLNGTIDSPIVLQGVHRTPVQIKAITSGSLGGYPYLDINSVKGSIDSPLALAAGEVAGAWKISGYTGGSSNAVLAVGVGAFAASANVSDDSPASVFTLVTGGGGSSYNLFNFDHTGQFIAPGAITPGIFADAAARDAGITTPTAGMMVFVTDIAKFQGYDGSAWVNLN